MQFDNRKQVLWLNKRRYITLLIYIVLMGLVILSGFFDKAVLGLNKAVYVICVSVVYILYIVFSYLKSYNFFSYSDDSDILVFKFVSLRPFDNAKKTIQIKKKDFGGYKIEKSILNFNCNLILSIKTKKGLAKYPPISISSLSEKQIKLLQGSLNQYA